MEKKQPIKKAEVAKLLSEFIAKNWNYCPIAEDVTVSDCECWGEERCAVCIRKHADQLN